MADRYGRRLPLMIDLVFFSIVEVLSGLAPNYTTFLILRALFGIGMGGEWGVGASLAMEKGAAALARPALRAAAGGLRDRLSAGRLRLLLRLPALGWRAMFFIGGAPALLAVFVRLKVKESEVWEKTQARELVATSAAASSRTGASSCISR